MAELDRYVSVDIEAAGPVPDQYSLLSIGACLVTDPDQDFYIELKPINNALTPESFAVHGLNLQELSARGSAPAEAMQAFDLWLKKSVPAGNPIFVAFNAPFDWMFVSYYFHRYLGRNPFGHSALDIKAFYMGRYGVPWAETSMANVTARTLEPRPLTHNALQDARDQAEIFQHLLKDS